MSTSTGPTQRTIQVVVGIVMVAAAFGGFILFSRLAGAPATKVSIVGAAHDLKTATVITDADLKLIEVETQPTGAVKDKALITGKLARHDIKAGEPVLDADLTVPAVGTAAKLYFALPAGKVAINIPAGDLSAYVQPGDRIDVIAGPKAGSARGTGSDINQYKTTLKGLRVLAVGTPQASTAGGTTTAGGNLIVECSLQDAEQLEFIIKQTDFTYALKSPLDAGAPEPTTSGADLPTFKQAFGIK